MSEHSTRDQKFLASLQRHPHLRERMESMLRIAEDAEGDLEKADEAERRIIDEVRKMGNELLTGWAQTRIEKVDGAMRGEGKLARAGKKNSVGTVRSAKSKSPNRSSGSRGSG